MPLWLAIIVLFVYLFIASTYENKKATKEGRYHDIENPIKKATSSIGFIILISIVFAIVFMSIISIF